MSMIDGEVVLLSFGEKYHVVNSCEKQVVDLEALYHATPNKEPFTCTKQDTSAK